MRCPHCNENNDKVIESRSLAGGDCIRRRRECLVCGYRFTSYERLEVKKLMVVKSDGRREPFDMKKIERGINRALEKRPISTSTVENLFDEIEDQAILTAVNDEIKSSTLGELVLTSLLKLDKVAYVRFASVYKKFNDLDEFIKEVKKMNKIKDLQ
jgi:transcriptional regulator nrdR